MMRELLVSSAEAGPWLPWIYVPARDRCFNAPAIHVKPRPNF